MGMCQSSDGAMPEGYKALKVQSLVQQAGDVREFYTFDKQLGKGNFGIVHLVYDKKTNEKFACKSISKVCGVRRRSKASLGLGEEVTGLVGRPWECTGALVLAVPATNGHFSCEGRVGAGPASLSWWVNTLRCICGTQGLHHA